MSALKKMAEHNQRWEKFKEDHSLMETMLTPMQWALRLRKEGKQRTAGSLSEYQVLYHEKVTAVIRAEFEALYPDPVPNGAGLDMVIF